MASDPQPRCPCADPHGKDCVRIAIMEGLPCGNHLMTGTGRWPGDGHIHINPPLDLVDHFSARIFSISFHRQMLGNRDVTEFPELNHLRIGPTRVFIPGRDKAVPVRRVINSIIHLSHYGWQSDRTWRRWALAGFKKDRPALSYRIGKHIKPLYVHWSNYRMTLHESMLAVYVPLYSLAAWEYHRPLLQEMKDEIDARRDIAIFDDIEGGWSYLPETLEEYVKASDNITSAALILKGMLHNCLF